MALCCWCGSDLVKEAGVTRDEILFFCPQPACRERQLTYSMKVRIDSKDIYLYLPTPRQAEFHESEKLYTLFGGAAGPGKSHALRWDVYRRCLLIPGYEALLLRRTFPELEKTHMRRAAREAPRFGANYVPSDHCVRFQNGSLLEFGHCDNDAAVSKYLSTEYDWIGFDELVTFEPDVALEIMTRARTNKPGLSAMVKAGSNPGGVGALWVLDFFIDKAPDPERYPLYDQNDWAFIPAKLDDNPYLDMQYEKKTLTNLSRNRYQQLRHGDWHVFEGQFFGKWNDSQHVVDLVPDPKLVSWFCSMDWGFNAPGCCLWWAAMPDGHYMVVDEYKFRETTVKDVAAGIHAKTKTLGLARVPQIWADPAIWQRTGQVGESIAETFQRYKVPVTKTDNDRLNGWQRVQEMLRVAPDGRPWLWVHPRCRYLIRTIPAMVRDAEDPEDVDTEGDDHACDALRYGAMSRRRYVDRTPPVRYADNQVGGMIQAERGSGRRILGESSVKGRRVA